MKFSLFFSGLSFVFCAMICIPKKGKGACRMPKNVIDFHQNYDAEEFAVQLYNRTNAQGELYLQNWYDVDCDDCSTYRHYIAKMTWTLEEALSVVDRYNELLQALTEIAQHFDLLDETYETAAAVLSNEWVLADYMIYVLPLKGENKQQAECEVVGRVGDGLFGYEMIRHARRLCRLLSMGAPKQVLQQEARYLIASMAVYRYAEEIARVDAVGAFRP